MYVYGMLVAGSNMHDINMIKRKLAKSFGMKDIIQDDLILALYNNSDY